MVFHATTRTTPGGPVNRPGAMRGSAAPRPIVKTSAAPAIDDPTGSDIARANSAVPTGSCRPTRTSSPHPATKKDNHPNASAAHVFPAPEPLPPRACGTGSRGPLSTNRGRLAITPRNGAGLTSGPICGTAPGAPHPVAPFGAGGPEPSGSHPPPPKAKNGSVRWGMARKSADLPRNPKIRDLLRRKIADHGKYGVVVIPETGDGRWRNLSMFAPLGFRFKGATMRSAEHALRMAWLEVIGVPKPRIMDMLDYPTAGAVRRQAQWLQTEESSVAKWQAAKQQGRFVDTLTRVIQARMNDNPSLVVSLAATRGAYLVYASGDPWLGCQTIRLPGADDVETLQDRGVFGEFPGDNLLGRALMTIRDTLFANKGYPSGWPNPETGTRLLAESTAEVNEDYLRHHPLAGPSDPVPTAGSSDMTLDPPPDKAVDSQALEEMFGPSTSTDVPRAATPLLDERDPDDPPPLLIDDTDPEVAEVVNGLVMTVDSLLLGA